MQPPPDIPAQEYACKQCRTTSTPSVREASSIVPIVDLRIKFALGSATYDEFTVVIILSVADRVIGVVVDGVSDVITLQPEAVQPPPQLGSVVDTDYILGMGSRDDTMIILVDIERLLRSTDFGLLDAPAATAAH